MTAVPVGIFIFGPRDAGMALSIIFLFLIAPVWSLLAGAFAGRDMHHLWSLPFISAALFFCGMWLGTGTFSTDFLLYAGVYLVLSAAAMLVAWLLTRSHRSAAGNT